MDQDLVDRLDYAVSICPQKEKRPCLPSVICRQPWLEAIPVKQVIARQHLDARFLSLFFDAFQADPTLPAPVLSLFSILHLFGNEYSLDPLE